MLTLFFERYAAVFLNVQAEDLSLIYDFPMSFYTESGDVIRLDLDTFTTHSQKVIGLYESIGVKHVTFDFDPAMTISEVFTLVSVCWHFNDADNNEIYSATTRYMMKLKSGKLKIKAVFGVDETSKYKEVLALKA